MGSHSLQERKCVCHGTSAKVETIAHPAKVNSLSQEAISIPKLVSDLIKDNFRLFLIMRARTKTFAIAVLTEELVSAASRSCSANSLSTKLSNEQLGEYY